MRRFRRDDRISELHRVEIFPSESRLVDESQIRAVRVVHHHRNARVVGAAGAAVVVDIREKQRVRTGERLL